MSKEELETKLEELLKERDELKEEALELIEQDKLDDAELKKESIAELDREIADVRKKLEELDDDVAEDGDDVDEDEEENDEDMEDEEMTVAEERKLPTQGLEVNKPEVSSELREFNAYLKGEKRDIDGGNIKTDSGFVLIPEEVVTSVLKLKELEFNLDKYITVKSVNNGMGKYPVVRQSAVAALPTVEELEPNPELAVKPFFELAYDIKTHRGYLRISREAIEDSGIDILAELRVWLARTIAATRNAAILNVLQNGGPGEAGPNTKLEEATATSVDDLKDIVNLNVAPNYENNVVIVSQSAWAEIDKMKDSNGKYMVQADVKDASVKRLLGARVEVLPDEILGSSDKMIFGNLKDAVVLFERSQYQAQWTDYMHFGECLMVAVRQDVRLLDHKAAVVVTLDLSADEE